MTCVATKINRDKTSALREYMHVGNDHELKYYVKHSYFLFTRLHILIHFYYFLHTQLSSINAFKCTIIITDDETSSNIFS